MALLVIHKAIIQSLHTFTLSDIKVNAQLLCGNGLMLFSGQRAIQKTDFRGRHELIYH